MCDQLKNGLMVQVNALHYLGSEEVFRICPLPDNEMNSLSIEKMQTTKSQGTRYAVLSVHTLTEKLEFSRILGANFKSPNAVLNFNKFARSFNSRADGVIIWGSTIVIRDEIVQVNQPTSLLNAVSPAIPVLGGVAAILPSVDVNSDVPAFQQTISTPPPLTEAWLQFIHFQQ
ncbi:hypothetical protein [Parasitella parasitica]|uniref:Uncharacterized protein n=1 Tax=Parasitella parasitica TaxID=35722 RepID=A0A0B7NMU8_9FUNG|nr:hypothetical protein [Parasitella parasitica]